MKLKTLTFSLLFSLAMSIHAANEKTTIEQVTDAVELTTDVDYIVTGDTPFATAGSVNIVNTEHAVLIISKIKPSKVLSNWMANIYINGEQAVDGENCQVKMYGRGAIIFPYGKDFQPLTCYTEQNYGGEACSNYSEGSSGGFMKSLSDATLNNQIRSFKLKRGYMVTFAIGTGGWGYSRCFIADQEDLEFATLPNILDHRISSYRLFKWHNAHKAGLASNGDYTANQALNTSWCYDWAQGNANNMPDTEWVPNHIYEDWPSPATCGGVTASCHMKNNNEPRNQSDDHPQELSTILDNWQNIMRTGMRLCSPSSWDGSDYWNGTGFIKTFLDSIDARGWRCDIVDAHCYWTEGNFVNLKNYWYPNMHRPIWISEWIWGASWSGGSGAFGNGVNNTQILNTTKQILENLNSMDCVERYAYWNSESKAHIYENGALTDLGKYYSTMDVGLGYKASNEFIPKESRLEGLTDFAYTYTRTKGTVALSWTDPNGDLMETITVQCKLPGATAYTNLATITPKDKNSAGGVTYAYTDTVADPGVYTYRIRAVSYKDKAITTEDATVNVAPAQGTSEFQYGRLSLDNLDENTIYYSESVSENPCVFIGTLTNKNTQLYAGNITAKTNNKGYFTYQLYPWQTTKSTEMKNNEEVPFLALKAGNYQYGDLACEAGVIDANKASDNTWTDVTEVTFNQPFPAGVTPIVLTEIRNPGYISADPKTTIGTRVFDVTNTGFKFIIYSEDASGRKISLQKKVCYFAITPGVGTVDVENSIFIAAGQGVDSQLYGSTQRENSFYLQSYDETGDSIKNEQLYLYQPTLLTALQTNNYPALCMLRRTDVTEKDDEGTTWTTGTRVKRQLDHDITVDGTTIRQSSTSDRDNAYRDNLGWVAITTAIKGASIDTGIRSMTMEKSGNQHTPQVVNGRIYIDGTSAFDLYNISGVKVPSTSTLTSGIYVVKHQGKTTKVLVR